MDDEYGTIVVGFSDDFVGNKALIALALNSMKFSQDEVEFTVDGTDIRPVDVWSIQYPTLNPFRGTIIDDGSDNKIGVCYEFCATDEVPLAEIASKLAAHIEHGSLHLTCSSNESYGSVQCQYLSVNADASAKRVSIYQRIGEAVRASEETC